MIALLVQRVNQLTMTLRCLPTEDPQCDAVRADLARARTELHAALCA